MIISPDSSPNRRSKIKQISIQNLSPTNNVPFSIVSRTPAQGKNSPSSPFPQLIRTMTPLSPISSPFRLNSPTLTPHNGQQRSKISSVSLNGISIKRQGQKQPEIFTQNTLNTLDPVDNLLLLSAVSEDKVTLSKSSKHFPKERKRVNIFKEHNIPRNKTFYSSKTQEFIVSSKGVLQVDSNNTQELARVPSRGDNYSPVSNIYRTQTTFNEKFNQKRNSGVLHANNKKFVLYNGVSPPSRTFIDRNISTPNMKFLKVRSGIVENWDSPKEIFNTLNSLESLDESSPSPTKEARKLKTQTSVRITFKSKERNIQKLLKRRDTERNSDLALTTEYNWLDRHNSVMARRSTSKGESRQKSKIAIEEVDCFANLSAKLGNNSNFRNKILQRQRQSSAKKAYTEEDKQGLLKETPLGTWYAEEFFYTKQGDVKVQINKS